MSPLSRVLFSSKTPSHATPKALYEVLNREFGFDLDPCPLNDAEIWDGCSLSWAGKRVFCNPPYGRGIARWLAKAREAVVAVYLLPARTDTAWWHDYVIGTRGTPNQDRADDVRFIRGRLKFGNAKASAPFPSVILVYRRGGAVACPNGLPTGFAPPNPENP